MLALRDIRKGSTVKEAETSDKELLKLRRQDLLELLLAQMREAEESAASVKELTELTDRLKGKLDDKDAQIEHLKERLDHKDERIDELNKQIVQLQEEVQNAAHALSRIDVDELMGIQRAAVNNYFQTLVAKKETKMERAAHAPAAGE